MSVASPLPQNAPEALIRLDGVTKVFYTDRSGDPRPGRRPSRHHRGEFVSIEGPSDAASPPCCRPGPARHAHRRPLLAARPPAPTSSRPSAHRIRNREFGFVFQAFNLIGDLTVAENASCRSPTGAPAAERKRRVHGALERVGMPHRVQALPAQLSGASSSGWRWRARWSATLDPARRRAHRQPRLQNSEAVMDLLTELHARAPPSAWSPTTRAHQVRRPPCAALRRPGGGRGCGRARDGNERHA